MAKFPCMPCGASGRCSACEGTGKRRYEPVGDYCPPCNGSGNCAACKGTGQLGEDDPPPKKK